MSIDIATLGIKVDSSSAVSGTDRLKGLETQSRKVETATQSMASQFSKLQGIITTLASTYALLKTARYIQDVALLAARYETLGISMQMVGKNAFYTKGEMDAAATGMQKLGISMIESRQQAMRMVQAQLDLNQSSKLARIAQDAAVIGNINSSEAFSRMIQGIRSGETEILKNIGLQVNMEQAYRRFETANNLVRGSISESQKVQARANAVIEEGAKIAGVYEAAMGTAGKQITSFPRYLEDFKVKMGEAFNPATTALVGAATTIMKGLQDEISKPEAQAALAALGREFSTLAISAGKELPGALSKVVSALSQLISIYNALPGEVVGAAGVGIIGRLLLGPGGFTMVAGLKLMNDQLERVNLNIGSLPGKMSDAMAAIKNLQDVLTGQKDWNTGMPTSGPFQGGSAGAVSGAGGTWEDPAIEGQRKREEIAKMVAAEAKAAEERKKAAEELKKLKEQDLKGMLAGIQAQMDADDDYYRSSAENTGKRLAEEEKAAEERKQAAGSEYAYLFSLIDEEQAVRIAAGAETIKTAEKTAEEQKKLAEQLPQMYRDVYEDIRGYEKDAYEASKKLIQKQADSYEKAGMDQVVIAKWKAEEEKKAYVKMLKASDDWTDGVKAGLIDITNAHTTWGTTAYNLTTQFATDASRAFGSNFKDIVKGDFDDIGAAWSGVWDNMLTKLGESIGDMLIEAAAKEIMLTFSAVWSAAAAPVIAFLANLGSAYLTSGSGSGTNGGSTLPPAPSGVSYAAEGGAIGGGPVWVGERGPELLFPSGPGYVMEHGQSVAYAARNGGYIPGRAEGGAVGVFSDIEEGNYLKSLGWVLGGPGGTGWVDPTGTAQMPRPYMTQWGLVIPGVGMPFETNDRYVNQLALNPGPGYIQHSGGWFSAIPWWAHALDTVLSVMSPAWGLVSGASKVAVGAGDLALGSNDKNSAWAMIAAGALQGYGSYGNLGSGAGGASAGYSAGSAAIAAGGKYAVGYALNYLLNLLLGQGEGRITFDGMNDNGLGASLSRSMADIAPKSNSFAFSARNGLDYVPYDGMRAELHKGERVQTAEERSNLSGEMKFMRAEMRQVMFIVAKNTQDTTKLLKKFDAIGMPTRLN